MDHRFLTVQNAPADTIQMYDTNTGKVTQINIPNLPPHLNNALHLHGIEAWIDPKDHEKLTFFLNNHGLPKTATGELQDPRVVGADSTIEIFETRLGSSTWTHVKVKFQRTLKYSPSLIVLYCRPFDIISFTLPIIWLQLVQGAFTSPTTTWTRLPR